MFFRRIVLNALLVGIVAGFVLSLIQLLTITPIIFAAEAFEVEKQHSHASDHSDIVRKEDEQASVAHIPAASTHKEHNNHHSESKNQAVEKEESWSPADGAERTFYTFISNIFAAIGFSALLLALMTQVQISGVSQLSIIKGFAWGIAGFIACFVAPGIGLPPEIPGIEAVAVEHRQVWWLLTAISVAAGLAVLVFAKLKFKILAPALMAIPYIMPIHHAQGPSFSHPDLSVVEALTQLHQQFIVAAAAGNFVFWLILGSCSAWAVKRFILSEATLAAHGELNANA